MVWSELDSKTTEAGKGVCMYLYMIQHGPTENDFFVEEHVQLSKIEIEQVESYGDINKVRIK